MLNKLIIIFKKKTSMISENIFNNKKSNTNYHNKYLKYSLFINLFKFLLIIIDFIIELITTNFFFIFKSINFNAKE